MTLYVVTVALPKNKSHDPKNKVTGPCPVSNLPCTDVTGEHHSFVSWHDNLDVEEVKTYWQATYSRVTRVEEIAMGGLR